MQLITNILPCIFLVHVTTGELGGVWESLDEIYRTYDEAPGLHHFFKYAAEYDENIYQLRETAVKSGVKVKMLEIGVQSGGSVRVWKRYFRGTISYVGLDIDKRCKRFESPSEGITIEIGSQLDTDLLQDLCATYGPFDLVVDDGGHDNIMMLTSLGILWGCLNDGGVYVIEDLHALNMMLKRNSIQKGEQSLFEVLGDWMRARSPPTVTKYAAMTNLSHPGYHLKKLSFYDSLVFLHYGTEVSRLDVFRKGSYWLPLKDVDHVGELSWCSGCYEDIL